MAKQKRLNKNLVAFLTVMGMVLVVSLFALVIYQQSRRDPEILAQAAREREAAGDLLEAAKRYVGAFKASENRGEPDTGYMINAAQCVFELGNIADWQGMLVQTHTKYGRDAAVLEALLDGVWRIYELTGRRTRILPDSWRQWGTSLADLKPENGLALASIAQGHWGSPTGDPTQAAEYARQAHACDPSDPRVVLTYIELLRREHAAALEQARQRGVTAAEQAAMAREYGNTIRRVFREALAARPGDVTLSVNNMRLLTVEAAELFAQGETDAAWERAREAEAAMKAATEATADRPDPELFLAHAQFLRARLGWEFPGSITDEDRPRLAERLAEIRTYAQRAIEIDKAVFDAYVLLADLARLERLPGDEALPRDELASRIADRMLDVYDRAREWTLRPANIRGQVCDDDRVLMLRGAFDVALQHAQIAPDAASREKRLARARTYVDDVRTRYQEHPLGHYMLAQLLEILNDERGAITAYADAREKAARTTLSPVRFWFDYANVTALPSERLALLYRRGGQVGEALRYAEMTLEQYRAAGRVPPVAALVNQCELLVSLERAQEALDLLARFPTSSWPSLGSRETDLLTAVKADALRRVGRTEEAERLERQVGREYAATRLWRLQNVLEREDFDTGRQFVDEMFADPTTSIAELVAASRAWLTALLQAERRDEALAWVQEKLKSPRPELERVLREYEVMVGEQNPEVRDQKLLALIAEIPDERMRNAAYFTFYRLRDAERAAEHLQKLRAADPADVGLLEQEFRLRVDLKQFARAGELLVTLSQHDGGRGADRAGGATYRGILALARGEGDTAVTEFREAVRLLPKSDALFCDLAVAYAFSRRYEEAADALQQAVDANPRSFRAWWLLRSVYGELAQQRYGNERLAMEERAAEAGARAADLNPRHPDVVAWQQAVAEERDPRSALPTYEERWRTQPEDAKNTERLGQLYVRAWEKAAAAGDAAALADLAARVPTFFDAALGRTTEEEVRFRLAQSYITFVTSAGHGDRAATLQQNAETQLRGLAADAAGRAKVNFQMLLAGFYEVAGNPDAAFREWQVAQQMIRTAAADQAERQRMTLAVGHAIMAFHRRQQNAERAAEACGWVLNELQDAAGLEDEIERVRQGLVEAYFEAARYRDAAAEIDRHFASRFGAAVESDRKYEPRDLPWLALRARAWLAGRQPVRAYVDLGRIIEMMPEDVWALYTRGALQFELGYPQDALKDLELARQHIARRPALELDVRSRLAAVYERIERYDQAIQELRAILTFLDERAKQTTHTGALERIAEEQQQVIARMSRVFARGLGQYDQAQRLISEYMERYPQDPRWPGELGSLFALRAEQTEADAARARARNDMRRAQELAVQAQQHFATAATYFQRAIERSGQDWPRVIGGLTRAIRALTRGGQAGQALVRYQEFERNVPVDQIPLQDRLPLLARLRVETALALQAQQQDAAARAMWKQAMVEAAAANMALLGDLSTRLGDAKEGRADAEAILRELLEADLPAGVKVRVKIALASHLMYHQNPGGALVVLDEVVGEVERGSTEHLSVLLAQAHARDTTGDARGALRVYEQLLEIYPDNVTALNNLAYKLVTAEDPSLRRPQEALAYAERLRALAAGQPNAALMLDTIGWVYHVNGRHEMAAAALEEAIQLQPGAVVYLHMGQVYKALNRTADAQTALQKGLQMAQQSEAASDRELIGKIEDEIRSLR